MENNGISKNTLIILLLIIVILVVILGIIIIFPGESTIDSKNTENSDFSSVSTQENSESINNENVSVVATMQDTITNNSSWCSTFQLVWNDLQDNLVGGDIIFEEQTEMVDHLNSQSFTENDISEEYYYKKWGLMTLSLKTEIEEEIKNKFDETSDILDSFTWPEESNNYFFYAMLKREFEFKNEFTILENSNFEDIENVEYFGINEETESAVRNQVEVLYYNDENDFAVLLNTNSDDEIILVRNPEGSTFEEIYNNINEKADKFDGSTTFGDEDTLSIPNLNINLLREYEEVENQSFKIKDGSESEIFAAMQTIKMNLDNKGGSIKSEASMGLTSAMKDIIETDEPRNFEFNGKFAIFLKEANSELPYFAANIENIDLFK